MDRTDLPPRPDPQTGKPRPPAAPRDFTGRDKDLAWNTWFAPRAPPGRGPRLEQHKESRRGGIITTVVFLVIMAGWATLMSLGFDWMTQLWSWAIVLGVPAASYIFSRGANCAVGADWFANGPRWVDLYELLTVTIQMKPLQGRQLRLIDQNHRKVTIMLEEAQRNPELWNLVYNGIRHSVANGAHSNALVDSVLKQYR